MTLPALNHNQLFSSVPFYCIVSKKIVLFYIILFIGWFVFYVRMVVCIFCIFLSVIHFLFILRAVAEWRESICISFYIVFLISLLFLSVLITQHSIVPRSCTLLFFSFIFFYSILCSSLFFFLFSVLLFYHL